MNSFFVKDGRWSSLSEYPNVEKIVSDENWNDWHDRVSKNENMVVATNEGTLFKEYGMFVQVFFDSVNNLYYINYEWQYDSYQNIYTDNIHDAMELYFKLSKDVFTKLKFAYIEHPCEIDVVKKDNMERAEYNYKVQKQIEAEERAERKRKQLEEKRLAK